MTFTMRGDLLGGRGTLLLSDGRIGMLRDEMFWRGRGNATAGGCSVRREVSPVRTGGVVLLRIEQSLDAVASPVGFGVLD
jgi:hypothetical protein